MLAQLGDVIRDGLHLAGAGGGGDHEKIGDGREAGDIQHSNIAAVRAVHGLRNGDGELSGGVVGRSAGWHGGIITDLRMEARGEGLEERMKYEG